MSYSDLIGTEDLVTYSDENGNIYGGGFNVNVVLMKKGISPMVTLNATKGNIEKVSDLFENLAIPNWAIAYKNLEGSYLQETIGKNYYGGSDDNNGGEGEGEGEDEVVDNDLYNKLLGFVSVDKDGNNMNEMNNANEMNDVNEMNDANEMNNTNDANEMNDANDTNRETKGGSKKKKSRRLIKNKNKKTRKN